MLRYFAIHAALLSSLLFAAPALAADVEGKVQTFDPSERTIVLDNGTKVWLSEGASADALREGVEVRVSYEERDGKNVATQIEVK
ncbi:MAG: DUF1344 domain-containing protein [Candidatus Rokubacteria bacterium]|nr:DUF1344 domain-containing protein [Candidatus Rokubacteria bacterium]